jgi:hypothetical protein
MREQVQKLVNLLQSTVYLCLRTFVELLRWKRKSFLWLPELKWRFEQRSSRKLSGKLEPKINRCSSLLLPHWFETCFDSSSSSHSLWLWSYKFIELVLELQLLRFDDDDSVVNLWELSQNCSNCVEFWFWNFRVWDWGWTFWKIVVFLIVTVRRENVWFCFCDFCWVVQFCVALWWLDPLYSWHVYHWTNELVTCGLGLWGIRPCWVLRLEDFFAISGNWGTVL